MKSVEIWVQAEKGSRWIARLKYKEAIKRITGIYSELSIYGLELLAAIQALKLLKEPCDVTFYTSNSTLVNVGNKVYRGNTQQLNIKRLFKQMEKHKVLWKLDNTLPK